MKSEIRMSKFETNSKYENPKRNDWILIFVSEFTLVETLGER
jgi:hypothetical protein